MMTVMVIEMVMKGSGDWWKSRGVCGWVEMMHDEKRM